MTSSVWFSTFVIAFAALAQTFRNLAQRSLTNEAGVVAATLVRFLYGLPFTALVLAAVTGLEFPKAQLSLVYWGWLVSGAAAQAAATAMLISAMRRANYVVAVTYSKTEVFMVVVLGAAVLAEYPTLLAIAGMVVAVLGIFWLASARQAGELRQGGSAIANGLGAGAAFAFAAVAFRAAGLELTRQGLTPYVAAALSVFIAQLLQSATMSGYLTLSQPEKLAIALRSWRTSLSAGLMGAIASFAWFIAYAIRPAAEVRALGLIEVVFGLGISSRWLHQHIGRTERIGIAMVLIGALMTCLAPA